MAENRLEDLDLKAASFDTDAIVDVLEHLERDPKSWNALIAEHGLDPKAVQRALGAAGYIGDGKLKMAVRSFVMGLRFGQMRLDALSYDPKADDNCDCFFCTLRRQAEAQTADDDSGETS